MNRSPLRSWVSALVLAVPLAAAAQVQTKAPPRLPPNASEAARIPSGVDTGSPVTSDALPLGTPVPPNASAGRTELTTRSAAARAAARPKLTASAADCTRKAAPSSADDPVAATGLTPRATPAVNPARPVSASGATARTTTRIDC